MADSFRHGLFACCSPMSTCCLGTWCPCILHGRTQSRLEDGSPSSCNGSCMGWFGLSLCGLSCLLQGANRGSLRRRFNIEGNACGDFCGAWCCSCCQLIQSDKEVVERGKPVQQGTIYQAPPQMAYKP